MAITDGLGEAAGNIFTGGGGVGTAITFLIIFLLVAIVGGVGFYFIFNAMRYNIKITILENLSGKGFVPSGSDRARRLAITDNGEEVLYLKKRKKYKAAYGKKIGKNHYAFAIGQDGYYYNITFGDLDDALREIKIKPIDRDMRYAHEGIRKNITQNFDKKNWLKENIGLIMGVISILLILIFMWLLADKYFTIFNQAGAVLDSVTIGTEKILEKQGALLAAIDNICSGGAVLQPA